MSDYGDRCKLRRVLDNAVLAPRSTPRAGESPRQAHAELGVLGRVLRAIRVYLGMAEPVP